MEILRREVRISKEIILTISKSSLERKLVSIKSLAIKLYSLVAEYIKSLIFKNHYPIVDINKSISTTLTSKY